MNDRSIAYFSREMALRPVMPTYSRGLGMLTGDNRRTAAVVASQLGLDAVEAEIEPAGKVAHARTGR